MTKTQPGPVLRAVFRAPLRLYDRGLGWLLGSRFLCLTHTGRRSGRRYRTVLEVIGSAPASGEVMVVAGLGPGADWYRNIRASPPLEVVVGRRRFTPRHRVLDEEEAFAVMTAYERRNRWIRPILRPLLGKLVGRPYDGSDAARRGLVSQLPIVAFGPRQEA
ncbi:nitroreductase family deazaflavin-dependent oxidoreductase [Amycolatopsis sp. NPDC059027]|uniref:nitroreductase family deazaflavin-dependent oxidoreductase n=1 Tax=unclassified Amycolatopsis TaxID=2618356 RepID=UPI00366BC943